MAITAGDVKLWGLLAGLIPRGGRVLELGRANWYLDAPMPEGATCPWAAARRFYADVLAPAEIVAVDLNGPADCLRLDLNEPLPDAPPFHVPFDVVINTGTLEHVFDQRRAWQTVHEQTAVGGVMVHSLPVVGWSDHGFYTYSACLLDDLAAANGYQPLACCRSDDLGRAGDRQLHLAWRRTTAGPFKVPQQGRYIERRDWRAE